jgi:hypothetical protein
MILIDLSEGGLYTHPHTCLGWMGETTLRIAMPTPKDPYMFEETQDRRKYETRFIYLNRREAYQADNVKPYCLHRCE